MVASIEAGFTFWRRLSYPVCCLVMNIIFIILVHNLSVGKSFLCFIKDILLSFC